MRESSRGLSILRIFAARARAEIERLRAETVLRESERRYRDLYEEAPLMYLSVGTNARIRRANRQATELLGYPLDQLLGRVVFDLLADTPNGRQKAQRIFQRFLADLEARNEELEWRRADGSALWTQFSMRPIHDAQGRVEATRSTHVDITDRKRAEEALRLSEERLSRIVGSAMDGIVTFDGTRRIELFNQAAEKIFGCPASGVIGQPLDRFLTAGFRQALEKTLVALAQREATSPYIFVPEGLTARRGDGREFHVEATISHVEVEGRMLYTLIIRDVDERRQEEERLRQLQLHSAYLQEEIRSVHNVDEIVGQSRSLKEVLEKAHLVAGTDSSVLILGETGTGKELIARAVHSQSKRKDRPLIKVNCAALPAGLIESELFGHEKGAFTGATERRVGRFELAHGGTILLDEIGEVPPEVQAKLLRVLQEHEFERVGGSKTLSVDARVITATNRDLPKAIAEGKFRQDLYYRLNVFPIRLPPLREREGDIPLLVHYFVSRYAAKIGRQISRVPREVMQRLTTYSWPGNVRELENVIERAVILSPGPELVIAADILPISPSLSQSDTAIQPLPAAPASPTVRVRVPDSSSPPSLEQLERNHILAILKQTHWRIEGLQGAASLLNLHPSTLRSRMKKLNIRRSTAESA
jgi:PAS domain S-box-containing protein